MASLLDFFIPRTEAHMFDRSPSPDVWHSEYLWGDQAMPGVVDKYTDLRAGRNKILGRLDLTAGERKGMRDPLARASQGVPEGGKPALTNVHIYDPKTKTFGKERVAVSFGQAYKGDIGFSVDQTARGATKRTGQKTANTGITGSSAPRMTEKEIKTLKSRGVEVRYNPMTQNAFTDMKGQVVKPYNGFAWQEGRRAWLLDKNWSTRGIGYYPTLESMPKDLRLSIKPGDMPYYFKGDARTPLGGSPSRFTGLMQYIPRGGR